MLKENFEKILIGIRKLPQYCRGKRFWYIVSANIVFFGIIMFAIPPVKEITTPIRFKRNSHGKLEAEKKQSWPPKPLIGLRFTTTNDNISESNMSGIACDYYSPVFCSNIGIITPPKNDLAKSVAEHLVTQIDKWSFVKEVTYYPQGIIPTEGESVPDVIINIQVTEPKWNQEYDLTPTISGNTTGITDEELAKQLGLPEKKAQKKYDDYITITTTATNRNFNDYDCPDSLRVPFMNTLTFDLESEITYKSNIIGLESRSYKYQHAGEVISVRISNHIKKKIDDLLKRNGEPPILPSICYPQYKKPPLFAFLKRYNAQRVASLHGYLRPTETFWEFYNNKETNKLLHEIHNELIYSGWKSKYNTTFKKGYGRYFYTRNNEMIAITNCFTMTITNNRNKNKYFVHYSRDVDDKTKKQIILTMLKQKMSLNKILWLNEYMTREQKLLAYKKIKSYIPKSAREHLSLCKLCDSIGETNKAKSYLKQAWLLFIANDDSITESEINDLEKKLKVRKTKITSEMLLSCGFHRIKDNNTTKPFIINLNQPARFFINCKNKRQAIFMVKVSYQDDTYKLQYSSGSISGGYCSSTKTLDKSFINDNEILYNSTYNSADADKRVNIYVKRLTGRQQFEVKAEDLKLLSSPE